MKGDQTQGVDSNTLMDLFMLNTFCEIWFWVLNYISWNYDIQLLYLKKILYILILNTKKMDVERHDENKCNIAFLVLAHLKDSH
jgi:hypothetical protein